MNKKIIEFMNDRYTTKVYDKTKKISDKDFMTIIEAARLAPSSFGYEPWKFILLKDKNIKQLIKPYTWGGVESLDNASHYVLLLAKTKKHLKPYSAYIRYINDDLLKMDQERSTRRHKSYENFINSDFEIVSEQDYFEWASRQVYIALTTMLYTAAQLNIDSTPIEGFERKEVEKILVENNVYNPEDYRLSVMAGFGYSSKKGYQKVRQPLNKVFEII